MIYLIIAIFFSSSIAIIFKVSELNSQSRLNVTTFNYATASIISGIMSLKIPLNFENNINFFNEFKNVIETPNLILSNSSSFIWSLIIGVPAGLFFFLSFLLYQINIKENGASLSGAFSKIGILVPMIISIILWKEYPTKIQSFGIILSLTSIFLINIPNKNEKKNFNYLLILLLLTGGMAEFSNKLFQKYAKTEIKSIFLFFVFISAFLISLIFSKKDLKKLTKKEILTGISVGIPNLFSSYFLILSLNYIKTSIAFTIYSIGSILIINIISFLFFKERLKKIEIIGIFIIILSLFLLNI